MKAEWNLKLLYASPKDPRIEKDVRKTELAYKAFAKKYRDTETYLKNEQALLRALQEYEALNDQTVPGSRAIDYFSFRHELNSFDTEAEAKVAQLSDRLTKAGNEIVFFTLKLGTIEKKQQGRFLKSRRLAPYRYFLKRIFLESRHQLTEKEEKILNLKSLPARALWIGGREKAENKRTVLFEGKDIPIAEALNLVQTLPVKRRRMLHKAAMGTLQEIGDFAESEINAVFTDKKINDELRGFKHPYSATILGYENDEKGIVNLAQTVTHDFKTSADFYALKKKILKLPHLEYADRSVGIGKVKQTFTFKESYQILREIFHSLGGEYSSILEHFVKEGQIDAFPKKGKSGGAYCANSYGLPTFVLLNHVNSFNSLMTFAHEMGHAIHTELSKSQRSLYQHYTMSVAETASTFFETAAFNTIFEKLSDAEKTIALHDRIQDDISTIYRQIAFFNFELELHLKIRKEGSVPKEKIAEMLNEHMKAYIGKSMKFMPEDGYFFVTVSHFRRPFYVYSYTYGQLISKALYEKFRADPSYMEKIKEFLRAGGSKSPEDIFGDIGINTKSPALFKEGLASVKKDIARLKKLTS
ncbi:hypothetical protein A3D62_03370 [Candidatus Kaiserbacteria bacterium RIFCSPHIGHO2_02_FULL_49_11]|uniref:Oligoendopeptidase F n=1 Tax=Candidatus Kaiserbacteria bacterium RIFCSPHIGHO2_02_FULL_49_11 TaxID=1798489 RepID=A0A1F6D1S6_9BACT|nr:MAG: hypothetical protein A3D62_03370 [Candidatus Kaiserbacteria bacterium RIFCSPHIGHO2_02_FULL_49_11]